MAETIREFLVRVGFQVDSSSEQRFERSIGRATLRAELLGKAIAGAAEAVVRSATRIAASFDEIYYASQRTQASVTNLKSLGYAVSQLGGSYQGAVQAIESFARNIRSNPGYESLVRSLGVTTRENGRLRDTVTMTRELAMALSRRPYYIQKQYFEALGLDERTFQALQSGDLARYMEDYRKKQEALGVDQEKAAEAGRSLTRSWRELSLTLATLGDRLMIDLAPSIERVVRALDSLIVRHQSQIAEVFRQIERAAVLVAEGFAKVMEYLGPLIVRLDDLAKQFTGEGALTVAMAGFAAWMTLTWLPKILAAFLGVSTGFAGMLLRLGISPVGAVAAIAGGAYALHESDRDFTKRYNSTTNPGGRNPFSAIDAQRPVDNRNWWQRTMPTWLGGRAAPTSAWTGGPGGARGMAGAQESYAFWRSKGLTHEQATGMVANEQAESQHNPLARGDGGRAHGLYQHHPDRRANILAGAGIDMSTASANQQRQGAYWEMTSGREQATWRALKNARTAAEAAAIVSQLYERPLDRYGEAYKRGANADRLSRVLRLPDATSPSKPTSNIIDMLRRAPRVSALESVLGNASTTGSGGGGESPLLPGPVSNSSRNFEFNQKTEITVLGGGDPQATGAAVAGAQNGVNSILQRNMQGAAR